MVKNSQDFFFLVPVCFILVAAVSFVGINWMKYKNVYDYLVSENLEYKKYLENELRDPISDDDRVALEYAGVINDTKLTVIFPVGTCGACAIQLIRTLQYYGFTDLDVSFFLAETDMYVINELKIGGFLNYSIISPPLSENVTSILLEFEDDCGWRRTLKYYGDYPHVLYTYLHYGQNQ